MSLQIFRSGIDSYFRPGFWRTPGSADPAFHAFEPSVGGSPARRLEWLAFVHDHLLLDEATRRRTLPFADEAWLDRFRAEQQAFAVDVRNDDDRPGGAAGSGAPDGGEELVRGRSMEGLPEPPNSIVCPITMALPLDPVTAADGFVYERSAVADWIAKGNGKSPKTNLPMGDALLPAPHVKNMIKRMVESGALSGDKAEAWTPALADQEEVREMREK